MTLVFELGGAGLGAEGGLEQVGLDWFAAVARGRGGGCGVQAIEDEEVALGVVHGWKGGDALEVVDGGESFHLVVFNVIPGDVPAGVVGADTDG